MKIHNRMISFRVSDEEFETYHAFCRNRGNGSVSNLARSAMRRFVEAEMTSVPPSDKQLEARIRSLELEVRRLAESLGERIHPESRLALAEQ